MEHVHNAFVATAALSLVEVEERSRRNRLALALLGDVVAGCSTARPPATDSAAATVIARVLPAHRGQGRGGQLYAHGLAEARRLGARVIESCWSPTPRCRGSLCASDASRPRGTYSRATACRSSVSGWPDGPRGRPGAPAVSPGGRRVRGPSPCR
ncbi:GNAT family N-acetyltransferase [Streptomyces sp. NPDC092903]|uniref:GNAT family N-acetyltransferase n=1 Tax=Streptomyces sp. NPDC092903 TaxID=3366017 RepID=UPI003819D5A2